MIVQDRYDKYHEVCQKHNYLLKNKDDICVDLNTFKTNITVKDLKGNLHNISVPFEKMLSDDENDSGEGFENELLKYKNKDNNVEIKNASRKENQDEDKIISGSID